MEAYARSFLRKPAAEQLIDGALDRFANDVPQRDLDATHGLDDGPLSAVKDRAFVHAMDEPIDLERVLAEHALGEPARDFVGERRVDDRLGNRRRRIDFADAADANIGVEL